MREIYYIIFIIAGISIGMSVFIGGFSSKYGTPATNSSFVGEAQNLSQFITQTEGNITSSTITTGGVGDFVFSILNGVWGIIKTLTFGVTLASNMVNDISLAIGIPGWATSIVLGIITVFIIFEIISLIQKYRV